MEGERGPEDIKATCVQKEVVGVCCGLVRKQAHKSQAERHQDNVPTNAQGGCGQHSKDKKREV
jgi:hypothetical protein